MVRGLPGLALLLLAGVASAEPHATGSARRCREVAAARDGGAVEAGLAATLAASGADGPGADHRSSFAPRVCIEAIELRGNTVTSSRLIRRALAVDAGELLSVADRRLRAARYKVLALGFFRSVELRFEKGSTRGDVVLVVDVVERGTFVLNRIFLGSSPVSPWWAGLDLGDRNFAGLGIALSGAAVFAAAGDHDGARPQRAVVVRLEDPAILGRALGWHLSAHAIEASEPYRIGGDFADDAASGFAAFDYRRVGGRGGLSANATPLARLFVDARLEVVRAEVPTDPVRELGGGGTERLDLHLDRGHSRVATVAIGFDRDDRPDPVLPYTGTHVALEAELGAPPLSDYGFARITARLERWWRVAERHVVSAHVAGGVVLGDAPRFDRFHVSDMNRMLSPRALGLVVSSSTALDVFETGADRVAYGEVGGVAEGQYAFRLFRRDGRIHGGDLFVGVGLWTLAERAALDDAPIGRALSFDLLLDAGLRLDTAIGIFELSVANGLGRLPL